MAVKLKLIIEAALKGKSAFKDAKKGLASIGATAATATVALAAMAAVAVGAFLLSSIKKAAEFSDTMQAVSAATAATEEEFKALEEEAKRIGATFGRFTATEAAEGMRQLAFAGFSVRETLEAVEPVMKLSQAGMIGLKDAARGVAGSLRSFGLDTAETGRVVDVMTKTFTSSQTEMIELVEAIKYVGPVASQAGVSFEEMNAAIGILADSSIRGGRAGTNLRNIIIKLQAPTAQSAAIMADLNLQIFELPPAALAAQSALQRDVHTLNELESQMAEVSAASQKLQDSLSLLNIEEAKNNLEIMKIRDKAADEKRKMTEEEIERIDELNAANRDLSIEQADLSIQQDELSIEEKKLSDSIEVTNTSMEEQTEIFNANKGAMKSLADIATEFNAKLVGLSDAQETEALATMFGLRNIAAFQILMRSMSGDVGEGTKRIDEFTIALENSAGTADEVSATMEEGLGNQLLQAKSRFEALQIEVVQAFMPALIQLIDMFKKDVVPAFESLIPVIATIVGLLPGVVAVLIPVVDKLTDLIAESGLLESIFSIWAAAIKSLSPLFNVLFSVISALVGIISVVISILPPAISILKALAPIIEIVGTVLETLTPVFAMLNPIIKEVVKIVETLVGFVIILVEPLLMWVQILTNNLVPILGMVGIALQSVGGLIKSLEPIIVAIANVMKTMLAPMLENTREQYDMMLEPILLIVDALVDALLPVIDVITVAFELLLPILGFYIAIMLEWAPLFEALIPLFVALIPLLFIQFQMIKPFIPLLEALIPLLTILIELQLMILIPVIKALVFVLVPLVTILALLVTILVQGIVWMIEWGNQLIVLKLIFEGLKILWSKIVDDISNDIENITTRFNQFVNVLKTIWGYLEKIRDTIDDVTAPLQDVQGMVTGEAGGIVGDLSNVLGFAGGGIVPGPIGAPVAAIVHGGEELRTPAQQESGKTVIIESSDTFDIKISFAGDVTDTEARRVGKMLARQITEEKRKGIGQLLTEVD